MQATPHFHSERFSGFRQGFPNSSPQTCRPSLRRCLSPKYSLAEFVCSALVPESQNCPQQIASAPMMPKALKNVRPYLRSDFACNTGRAAPAATSRKPHERDREAAPAICHLLLERKLHAKQLDAKQLQLTRSDI